MSDLFKNIPLFRNKPFGTPAKADELRGKVVALYFGAKEVDPVLINKMKDFYNAGNALGFEVVYISHDINEDDQKAFLANSPAYLYTKYGDPKTIGLLQRYSLTEIPTILLIQKGGTPLAVNKVGNEIKSKDPATSIAAWKKMTTE